VTVESYDPLLLATPAPTARRSPLAHRRADLAAASGASLSLTEIAFPAMLNLRLDPNSSLAADLALPGSGRAGDLRGVPEEADWQALWLGPDEWLLVGPDGGGPTLLAWLLPLVAAAPGEPGRPASLVDLSANYATVLVAGRHARDLLEKAITLDLHPRAFSAGSCALTTFARATVLLWQIRAAEADGGPQYRVIFRPSFGTYLSDWLIDAAAEF